MTLTATVRASNGVTAQLSVPDIVVSSGAPVSVFTTQVPALANITDGVQYELGMKFQSSAAGQITKLRFWKGSGETAGHVGHIWSANGTSLAAVTFIGETASGWQTQALLAPLGILANTTYVVSVGTTNNDYVATNNGLAAKITNGALSTIVGGNGVYGARGAFPTNTFQTSNYFRDVVFVPGVPPPPDTIAPSVPTNLAGVPSGSAVALTWTASTDNIKVVGYNIYRGGAKIGSSATANYVDATVLGSTTYSYAVSAFDAAGNKFARTAAVNVTTSAISGPRPPGAGAVRPLPY